MGAFNGVQLYFKKPLSDIAKSFNYSEANIFILEGNENGLRQCYPDVYRNLISCIYHADRRTPFMYGQDLVASWLFEDAFISEMQKSTVFSINLDGADKNREILPNVRISAASDYQLSLPDGCTRKLELMTDYTGFWVKTGKLHLRDAKYTNMVDSQSLFVAVSVITKEFAIYDFSLPVAAKYIPNHKPYGGKSAYEININRNMMLPYNPSVMISEIEKLLKK